MKKPEFISIEKAKKIAQVLNPIDADYKIIQPKNSWNGLDLVEESIDQVEGNIVQIDLRPEVPFEDSFRFYDEGLFEHRANSKDLEDIKKILSETNEVNFKIKKAVIVTGQGTDEILLTIDGPTAYPIMQYDTLVKISTQKGYGEEYCKTVLGINPNVIKS